MKPIQLSIRSNNLCSTHTIVTAQWLSNRNEVQKGRRPENVGVYCGCEMPLTNGRGRFFQVRFWLLCCGSHFVTSSEPVKCAFGNRNNPVCLFSSSQYLSLEFSTLHGYETLGSIISTRGKPIHTVADSFALSEKAVQMDWRRHLRDSLSLLKGFVPWLSGGRDISGLDYGFFGATLD